MLEKRKFVRLSSDSPVKIKEFKISKENLALLQYKMKNISLGGVFLETDTPLSINSVVDLEIPLPGKDTTIRAVGLVRWHNKDPKERGMGVEFIKVTSIDKKQLVSYLEKEGPVEASTPSEMDAVFTSIAENEKTTSLMLAYFQNIEKEISFDKLSTDTGLDVEELEKNLNKLRTVGMAEDVDDRVKFKKPGDNNLWIKIVKWAAQHFLD